MSLIDFRALSLRERAKAGGIVAPAETTAAARARVRWWRTEHFRQNETAFRLWLHLNGISGPERLIALAERDDLLRSEDGKGAAPEWHHCLAAVMKDWEAAPLGDDSARLLAGKIGSATLIDPFMRWGGRRIAAALDAAVAEGLPVDRTAVEADLTSHLAQALFAIAQPTAALALNSARLEGRLEGDTSEARAQDFARRLLMPEERRRVVTAYPVLDRKLSEATSATCAAVQEMLAHLQGDLDPVRERFALTGPVTRIGLGLGDPHRLGRTVARIEFGTGSVIYKPRSLAADIAFQNLLLWLSERIEHAPPTQVVIDRGDHGWCEFIKHADYARLEEVRCVFEQMGALLAALNLCGASDLHHENLIFRTDGPFAVDLETVLTGFPDRGPARKLPPDELVCHRTVLRVGYLPRPAMISGVRHDPSAAGLIDEQDSPVEQAVIMNLLRDDVEATPVRNRIRAEGSVVKLAGQPQQPRDHVEQIVAGFRRAYRVFEQGKHELLGSAGPVEAFRSAEVRWVARPTLTYAIQNLRARHPTSMRDGLDQEMAFAGLWTFLKYAPHHRRVLAAELRDLWAGDIPYFSAPADSLAVFDSRGEPIEDIFEETAFDGLRRQVHALAADDLERQEFVIRTALKAAEIHTSPELPGKPVPRASPKPVSAERFLEQAVRIGDHLLRRAHVVEGTPSWFSVASIDERNSAIAVTTGSLYQGRCGIGLFFAELAEATGDRRYRRVARQCRTSLRRSGMGAVGAYEGLGGLLYGELRFGEILGNPSRPWIRRLLGLIRKVVPRDRQFDIMAGAAGGLVCAIRAATLPDLADEALETARFCAEHLNAHAETVGAGARWTSASFEVPMTGFSHGGTGIALALAEYARATSDSAASDLAWRALSFEEDFYDPLTNNWRDTRGENGGAAWCHGAPGITLGRQAIAALGLSDEPPWLRPSVQAGLVGLEKTAAGGSHCLCHGALGNVEPLLAAGGKHARLGRALAVTALLEAEQTGWRCGLADFAETPGLMVGLAGVGYGFLRQVRPHVPDVLTLQLSRG